MASWWWFGGVIDYGWKAVQTDWVVEETVVVVVVMVVVWPGLEQMFEEGENKLNWGKRG
jgi:hypothetical protein